MTTFSGPDGAADRRAGAESSLDVIAKSSAWQGFLGGASVIATSILLEVLSKLLESWVDESRMLASVSSWLSRVAALIVALAVGYLAWRWLAEKRRRWRVDREIQLTADLVPPGPDVAPGRSEPVDSPHEVRLGPVDAVVWAVLRQLPFDEYEAAALYEMVSAMVTVAVRLPMRVQPDGSSAQGVLEQLTAAGVLRRAERDRVVVLRDPPPEAPDADLVEGNEWRAAVPALVRHHADRARRWAVALDSVRLGGGARRWFEQEEHQLRGVLSGCRALAAGGSLPGGIPELVEIADALDVWYARNGWSAARNGVAEDIATIIESSRSARSGEFAVEHELAEIRAARHDSGPSVTRLHRYHAGLSARRAQRDALRALGWALADSRRRPGGPSAEPDRDRFAGAEKLLERAWKLLPRKDVAGEVGILIDLSVVHLHQGRVDVARNRLAVAESLARDGRDPAGLAQVHETLGVLWWIRGEPRRALRYWQRALTRYRELDHALGIARCLQHLGSAMRIAPEYGGLLLRGEPNRRTVWCEASGWLAESEAMRPEPERAEADRPAPPPPARAELEKIRARLGDTGARRGIRRWPETGADDG
ncbi:tetratricopeptide repeat protein [Nocardia thraciensis]